MPLVDGVKEYLPRLARIGQLFGVTSNYGNSLRLSKEVLAIHGLLQYLDDIYDTGPGGHKSDLVASLNLDYYLDDETSELKDIVGLKTKLYLFNWGHNSQDNCESFATRVYSFQQFFQLINQENLYGNTIRAISSPQRNINAGQ